MPTGRNPRRARREGPARAVPEAQQRAETETFAAILEWILATREGHRARLAELEGMLGGAAQWAPSQIAAYAKAYAIEAPSPEIVAAHIAGCLAEAKSDAADFDRELHGSARAARRLLALFAKRANTKAELVLEIGAGLIRATASHDRLIPPTSEKLAARNQTIALAVDQVASWLTDRTDETLEKRAAASLATACLMSRPLPDALRMLRGSEDDPERRAIFHTAGFDPAADERRDRDERERLRSFADRPEVLQALSRPPEKRARKWGGPRWAAITLIGAAAGMSPDSVEGIVREQKHSKRPK